MINKVISIITAISMAVIPNTYMVTSESPYVTVNGVVTAANEVTLYDAYDGNVYAVRTEIGVGEDVIVKLDTRGTTDAKDDIVVKVSRR